MDKDFMLNYYDKMVRPIWTELMKTPRYQRVACEHDKLEREFRRLLDEKLGRKYLELDDALFRVMDDIAEAMYMHYNPFSYVHSEKDILKLVTTLMTNTKGEGSGGDPFWEKSERLLLTALIAYLHYEAPVEEQNFATLLEMLNTMQVLEDDEEYQNPVDLLFEDLAKTKPNSFAGRQYKLYKLAAGVVCFKRLIHHDMSKSLKTYKATKQKGDPHEQTENNRPV